MSHTMEVKQRLNPIMERMRASLAKIQMLEEKLNLQPAETILGGGGQRDNKNNNNDNNNQLVVRKQNNKKRKDGGVDADGSKNVNCVVDIVPGQSRALLRRSMDMIKKKITALQTMEELLHASEDRRQNLQHFFLQSSLSKQALDLASSERQNKMLIRQVETLEKDVAILEDKCSAFDELQLKVITLSAEARDFSDLEHKLELMEQDLVQRQSKITQQAIQCDDLECQVEELTATCDNLRFEATTHKKRSAALEQELKEMKSHGGRSRPPHTIINSKGSESTSVTATDSDSSTEESMLRRNSSMDHDDSFSEGENDFSEVQRLRAQLERANRENAELRHSNEAIHREFNHLLEINLHQESRIAALEQGLPQKISTTSSAIPPKQCSNNNKNLNHNREKCTTTPAPQQGRGFFLKKVLQADAKQFKQLLMNNNNNASKDSRAEKARQISAALTAKQ